jgi:hypothetical protein
MTQEQETELLSEMRELRKQVIEFDKNAAVSTAVQDTTAAIRRWGVGAVVTILTLLGYTSIWEIPKLVENTAAGEAQSRAVAAADKAEAATTRASAASDDLTAMIKTWSADHSFVKDVQFFDVDVKADTELKGGTVTKAVATAHFPSPVDFVVLKSIDNDADQLEATNVAPTPNSSTDYVVSFYRIQNLRPTDSKDHWIPEATLVGIKIVK